MKLPRIRLRERVATMMEISGAAPRILRARARSGAPWLTVLTYHRVCASADSGGFDDGVVDATTDELTEQLALLARDFTFVTTEDVRRWFAGRALPKNPVLLTFDDAYRECREVALPILQRFGAHAAFFVSTQHVEQRRVFWWDRASHLLRNAKVTRAELPAYGMTLELATDEERAASLNKVLRAIKDRFGLAIDPFLEAIAQACAVEWTTEQERAFADRMIATWDDVRAIRAAGMEVQSHTRTHRVLQTLSPRELAEELGGAREELEAILREPVRALAYPTGRPVRTRADITAAVRAAGYDLAFENAGGVNARWLRTSPLRMHRIPMASGRSLSRFEAILALPHLQ